MSPSDMVREAILTTKSRSKMDIPAERHSRYVQLDALRGIAALMVVYAHCVEFRIGHEPASAKYLVYHFLNWGRVGVAAFFCISGFVIPYSFGKSARPARAFVISRIARLYPAYWCSILAAVISWHVMGRPGMPVTTILANATMLQQLMGQPDVLGVYWTLVIELMFYALCLVAFLAGCLRSPVLLFVAALVCVGLGGLSALWAPPLFVPAMSLGLMFLACLWRHVIIEHEGRATVFISFGIAAWLLTLALTAGGIEDGTRLAESWIFGITLFAVATVLRVDVPGALIGLGAISYGVYLYHELVSGAVTRILPGWANTPHVGFFFTALGTIGIASISYKLLEHPCIRFGKSLADPISQARKAAEVKQV